MSLPYEPSKTTTLLKNALSDILHVSTAHASKIDRELLQTCKYLHVIGTEPCFVLVPEDDNSLYQKMIDDKFSFAFVSLLQVARRNGASYLHISEGNDAIAGLHTFCEPL